MAGPSALAHTELAVLRGLRRRLGHPAAVGTARALSGFGEHAAGWVAAGLVGAALDRGRRRQWLVGTAAVATAHLSAIAVKRVVRRVRPPMEPLCGTPSRLSFPSAHACSTAAAATAYAPMLGVPAGVTVTAAMGLSRLLLGVHYPTDVVAGVAVGTVVARAVRLLGEPRR
jgi:membrane-associated phospholipid phosphatase